MARSHHSTIDRELADKNLDEVVGAFESSILQAYWNRHEGNRAEIARRLGITVRSLRYRLSKYGIGSFEGDE
jgi:DNA-binding NtrC family response regulator